MPRLAAALVLLALATACASAPEPKRTPEVWDARQTAEAEALELALRAELRTERGQLTIRLAFEAPADLDLWVTDPDQESIYYFNRGARSGGVLDADLGCGDAGRRIESVRFAAPSVGRYRVGVDHPRRCAGADDAAVFVVSIDDGERLRFERGIAPLGVFRAIVREFEWPAADPD